MTTGHVISDNRSFHSNICGEGLIGEYYERIWGGDDQVDFNVPLVDHSYSTTVISSFNPFITWGDKNDPNDNRPGSVQTCFGNGPLLQPLWDGNDDLRVFNKMFNKVRGNEFNMSNFVAEGRQSVALLTQTATRLATFLESIRHGNIQKAARVFGGPTTDAGSKILRTLKNELTPNGKSTGSLANAILETQYGWRPLLKDAYAAGESLGAVASKPTKNSYRVTRKIVRQETTSSGGQYWTSRTVKRVSMKATLVREPSASTILRMNDPLGALYEVTPWSFIADWFLPIGEYLTALHGYRNIEFSRLIKSTKVTKTSRWQGPINTHTIKNGGGDYYLRVMNFDREIVTLDSIAELPLPTFKPLSKAFSPEHALNAFALLNSTANRFTKSLKF